MAVQISLDPFRGYVFAIVTGDHARSLEESDVLSMLLLKPLMIG